MRYVEVREETVRIWSRPKLKTMLKDAEVTEDIVRVRGEQRVIRVKSSQKLWQNLRAEKVVVKSRRKLREETERVKSKQKL